MQELVEGAPEADRLSRRGVARAFRGRAARAARCRHSLPHQPAPGARPRLLQPHRVRMGHRPTRRAGHGLCRWPLRRPGRAARRQAGAGLRLRHGRRAPAGAVERRRAASRRRRRPMSMSCIRARRPRAWPSASPKACATRAFAVQLHCGGGSFKSQMKRADASRRRLRGDHRRRRGGDRRSAS